MRGALLIKKTWVTKKMLQLRCKKVMSGFNKIFQPENPEGGCKAKPFPLNVLGF